MRANVPRGRDARRELVFALERARTRLAVSVAAEMKTTRAELWSLYLDTEERVRRRLKVLRAAAREGAADGGNDALEALRRLPLHLFPAEGRAGDAWLLCRHVREALDCLEESAGGPDRAGGEAEKTDAGA